jgi:hypothetical protein
MPATATLHGVVFDILVGSEHRVGLAAADGGSDRFIDAMVLWGDADTVGRGLRAHFTAGATHVCLQPIHADGDFAARDRMLAALADT